MRMEVRMSFLLLGFVVDHVCVDETGTPVPQEPQLMAPMSSLDFEFGDESD